jgi:hypothetical protein
MHEFQLPWEYLSGSFQGHFCSEYHLQAWTALHEGKRQQLSGDDVTREKSETVALR